ncbi:pentatricopeptide repeat-containing protein At5g14080 isoform X3 [Dendrobium catenatum]|uniref:pentatricopeptide repeat-containing protein At5g14080 isoform X3 n=1 Tax=Dendrobium catenatum TaxID=906689 RepID=UPI0010A02779|nr:pentatricopeptide repeat-containing protein At5g14080 isoform X3 [Dendrobium catenatum]
MQSCRSKMSPLAPISTVAHKLSRALISASKPSQRWSSAVEETLRSFLFSSSSSLTLTPTLVSSVIDPHLLHHHSLAAGLFHFASHQPSFSHSPLSFHSFLKSLSISRHPHSILSLLKLARTQQIPLLPSSITLAASSLLHTDKALDAAEILKNANNEFPPTICNSVLAAVSSGGFLVVATQLFDVMLLRGIQFSTVGFGCFIGKFSRVNDLQKTLDLVEKVKSGMNCRIDGSIIAVLTVDSLCRAGRIDDAWRALEELRRRDCKPDFIAYRIVSEGFKSVGRLDEMETILKQKRKLGVAPRANDYKDFIFSLISERRVLEAKDLGEGIVNGDFPIEDDVLNALIGSVSTLESDSAVMFCKYMIEKDRFPSLLALKNMSKNLCKDGRVKEAYGVLNKMKKKGFKPDTSTYNFLLEALCREDLLRPAKKLWDEMFTNGCCANLRTYNILIKKFSLVGETNEALKLYDHMLRKGVVPNDVTYSSTMKLLCQDNKICEALDIFNHCLELDTALASSTLRTLVLSLCSEGNYVYASHVMHGVPDKIESCDSDIILLKSLADAGEMDMAAKHVEWVKNNSPFKLQEIVNQLHESLSTTPKLDSVLQLLRSVQSQGLISDVGNWTKFYEGFH